eukprot:CAMPEP_0202887462 /NCGR_PEP_ID=MMETSP1391-20130828/42695_1 /ASSEMBLY_ACC=CAM_ASM_000867 /TAXON_ID=1034604 /ORGANISM="Chlamydomonas leiostraca, Strain SAG 11-49" /LENGTH=268 /DNA_ID=CAMNT_0049570751 /DNA_START=106 /DNA_END=912 /DNA_ORIENTATION=+
MQHRAVDGELAMRPAAAPGHSNGAAGAPHVLLLVCAWLDTKKESAAMQTGLCEQLAASVQHVGVSEHTARSEYFPSLLAQQPNLRRLLKRLLAHGHVTVAFLYDVIRGAQPHVHGITHVVLSGGNYNHDKVPSHQLHAVLSSLPRVPAFGICFGFQLLARQHLGATMHKMEVNADGPRDVRALAANMGAPIEAGDAGEAFFHHKNQVMIDWPGGARQPGIAAVGGFTVAWDGYRVVALSSSAHRLHGVQWHPERHDDTWAAVAAFLAS